MEETFQFHPRRTIEGSVSRIAKWIPVRSALVEESPRRLNLLFSA